MNYKDKIGHIKAVLCNASNSLATTPDLWVLTPAPLSLGVHQLNSRVCFFGARCARELRF